MKKLILSLIPLAALAAACNTVKIEQPLRYGQLSISLADEPVVEVETKAGDPLEKDSDAAKNYTVRVFNSSHVQQGKDVSYYDFATQTLPLGTYYVTAENCTEAEAESADSGKGKKRIAGMSANVTLTEAALTGTATVDCVVTNALVSVQFDESVVGRFTDLKVTLSGGTTRSEDIVVNETAANVVTENWFNPSNLNYTISGTFTQLSKPISLTGSRTLAAKDNIKILVKVNTENGQLSIATINVDTSVNTETQIEGEFNPYK